MSIGGRSRDHRLGARRRCIVIEIDHPPYVGWLDGYSSWCSDDMPEPMWSLDSTYYAFTSFGGHRDSLESHLRETMLGRKLAAVGTYAFGSFGGGPRTGVVQPLELDTSPGPRPFVHFVAKVISRCNIKCDYCYMYEHADQTWRTMPPHMSDETETAMIDRVGAYLVTRRVPEALVILHGGEPLLYGPSRIDRLAERLRRVREGHGIDIGLALQTNATVVTDANLRVLIRHRVHVGVSLDGPSQIHDAHRRDKRDRGTHERVVAGLRRLLAATSDGLPAPAVTAVINPAASPREIVEHFVELGIETVDFQLPDLNHDTYPHAEWAPGTFGAWLIELYDVLCRMGWPLRVRSIDLLIHLLLGGAHGGDILGQRSYGTLIIETDGSYHTHDALKTAIDGATATGTSVSTDSILPLETHPMALAFTDKASAAADACQECELFAVCGGGLVAHRYGERRAYDNPSVYCVDLALFIRYVDRSIDRSRKEIAVPA